VVLRLPALAAGLLGFDHDRLVGDHGRGREALLERGRVDEGLERGAGLAPGLRDMVELVAPEVEPADQGANRAVLRIQADESRLHLGQLRDLPALAFALHADDRAAPDALLRRRLRVERASGEAQRLAGNRDPL